MATAPLWNRLDPLPILAGKRSEDEREREIKERIAIAHDRRERALRKLFRTPDKGADHVGGVV